MITHKRLLELLEYDKTTGLFRWKVSKNRARQGDVAGCLDHYGYVVIRIDRILYKAHRLAVFYVTGSWPVVEVDHEDLDRANNKYSNLREASVPQNRQNIAKQKNNKSGYKGVCWHKQNKKWHAQIMVNRKHINLGFFDDPAVAHAAYSNAANTLHAKFARV